jgi:putative nucleotidyltransferase with HDIG domain
MPDSLRLQLDQAPGSAAAGSPPNSCRPSILVIEDNQAVLNFITAVLKRKDLLCDQAVNLGEARFLLAKNSYDIVFLDLGLPDGSGLSIFDDGLHRSHQTIVVVITGKHDLDIAIKLIREGAYDYITKPFSTGLIKERLDRVLDEWMSRLKYRYYQAQLEKLVENNNRRLLSTTLKIEKTHDMTVTALGAALDLKDPETEDHCLRVSRNSVYLGTECGFLNSKELKDLKWGAYLHDIGKIGVPENVLLKRSALSEEEMKIVKKHPSMGFNMLANIDFLSRAAWVVLYHHEKYDGSGYPFGLKGEEIPLTARIFSIIDAMDAITSDRPYRRSLSFDSVVKELKKLAGKHFDPEIVKVFLRIPESSWLTAMPRLSWSAGPASPVLPASK